MKRSKFTEEQIAYALRQIEAGTAPVVSENSAEHPSLRIAQAAR